MTMIVLVVSNHTLLGRSLASMLHDLTSESPMEARLCEASQAVRSASDDKADVILVEAIVDFAGAILTTRALTGALPGSHVVLLATDHDEASVFEAISAGAEGYLARDTSPTTLARTLAGVAQGELGLPRKAALVVMRQLRRSVRSESTHAARQLNRKLTAREQEIFDLVRRGLRSRDISQRLCIAEATVYKHIQNILDKFQVHSRTQAVIVAQLWASIERAAPPSNPEPRAPSSMLRHSAPGA
jgi:two-component system, NarL family, nitrate/nitrite response regulator NarL